MHAKCTTFISGNGGKNAAKWDAPQQIMAVKKGRKGSFGTKITVLCRKVHFYLRK